MVHQVHERTVVVISKATKSWPVCLAVIELGKEFTLHRMAAEPKGAVGPSYPKGPVIFPVLNDSLSVQRDLKTKQRQRQGQDQSRGESPKEIKDLQITKLGDDQERRNTQQWRKTEMDRV